MHIYVCDQFYPELAPARKDVFYNEEIDGVWVWQMITRSYQPMDEADFSGKAEIWLSEIKRLNRRIQKPQVQADGEEIVNGIMAGAGGDNEQAIGQANGQLEKEIIDDAKALTLAFSEFCRAAAGCFSGSIEVFAAPDKIWIFDYTMSEQVGVLPQGVLDFYNLIRSASNPSAKERREPS